MPNIDTDIVLIYVTIPDLGAAERLARAIVELRLAACANILPGMRSIYWWNEAMEEADEVVVLFKTKAALAAKLTDAVVAMHPYETPCVLHLPVSGGSDAFLSWISSETQ